MKEIGEAASIGENQWYGISVIENMSAQLA
jgi:hypothetical protein